MACLLVRRLPWRTSNLQWQIRYERPLQGRRSLGMSLSNGRRAVACLPALSASRWVRRPLWRACSPGAPCGVPARQAPPVACLLAGGVKVCEGGESAKGSGARCYGSHQCRNLKKDHSVSSGTPTSGGPTVIRPWASMLASML